MTAVLTRIFVALSLLFAFDACKQKANDDASLFAEAKTEIDNGDFETAVVLLDTLIERNASNDSAIYYRGIALSKLGYIEYAIADFSLLVKISETLGNKALNQRGILYYQSNEHEKAMQDFNKAIKNDPKDFHTYYSRGILKTVMEIFGKSPDPSLGYLYTEIGNEFYRDYKGALEDFNKAIELDSTFVDTYVKRAKVYEQFEQNDKAFANYNKAISLDSKFADAYLSRALLYKHLNKYSEALNDFNTAIDLDPKNPFPFANRGYLKKENNNKIGACEDFRKAASLGLKMTEEDLTYCN